MKKARIYIAFFAMLSISMLSAQTYEYVWAKRGGGIDFLNNGGDQFNNSETVRDIVVDSQDNYYFLCNMTTNSTDFDGNPILMADEGDLKDIVLVSTTCDGTFRWSKTFGSWRTDNSEYISIDQNDNIYLGFRLDVKLNPTNNDTRIDNDLIITSTLTTQDIGPHARVLYLVSYDSNGALRWIDQPEDPQAVYNNLQPDIFGGIHVDSNGVLHTLMRLGEGTHLNGNIVVPANNGTDFGQWFMVKYDALGTYLSHTFIPLDGIIFQDRVLMEYDEILNRYYIAISEFLPINRNISYNNNTANHNAILLSIDDNGNEIWRREPMTSTRSKIGDLDITATGNLQIAFRGGISNNPETFGGFTFPPSSVTNSDSFLAVIQLNPAGNLLWGQSSTFLSPMISNFVEDYNGVSAVATALADVTQFAGFTYQGLTNAQSDPVHFTLDTATGTGLTVNSIEGNFGFQDGTTAVAFDSHGNIILGGFMRESLFLNHPTLPFISRSGGRTDLWVAKLAKTDCNGNPLSIKDTGFKNNLHFKENPVNDVITILGLEDISTRFKIYSMTGRVLKEGELSSSQNTIDISTISSGSYFIQMYQGNKHETIKFLKE